MAEIFGDHAIIEPLNGTMTGPEAPIVSSRHECGNRAPYWLSAVLLLELALGGCGILSSSTQPACDSDNQGVKRSSSDSSIVRSLRRQLNEKEYLVTKLQSRLNAFEQAAEDSPPVQALRRELDEKEEHITKLQSRLNALKLIEEDRQKRKSFRHRRATIIPPK